MRCGLIILMLLMTGLTGGCHFGAPHPPAAWVGQPATFEQHPGADTGEFMVILGYGPGVPNHACAFLTSPARGRLFWDPGGSWAEDPQDHRVSGDGQYAGVVKSRDLVTEGVPALHEYLQYRWHLCGDSAVAIFTWTLPAERAEALFQILLEGTTEAHPAGAFSSQGIGLFCCTSLSDFMMRFGSPEMPLSQNYFLPQSLERELYTLHPDGVWIQRRAAPMQRYALPDDKR